MLREPYYIRKGVLKPIPECPEFAWCMTHFIASFLGLVVGIAVPW